MKYIPELPENIINEVNDKGLNYYDKFDNFTDVATNQNNSELIFRYREDGTEKDGRRLLYITKLTIDYDDRKISAVVNGDMPAESVSVNFSYDVLIDPVEDPKELVIFAINYYRWINKDKS